MTSTMYSHRFLVILKWKRPAYGKLESGLYLNDFVDVLFLPGNIKHSGMHAKKKHKS